MVTARGAQSCDAGEMSPRGDTRPMAMAPKKFVSSARQQGQASERVVSLPSSIALVVAARARL